LKISVVTAFIHDDNCGRILTFGEIVYSCAMRRPNVLSGDVDEQWGSK
jgi:hypothetical protein